MEGENKTQPRIIRGDFNDQELVIFLKVLAEKLEAANTSRNGLKNCGLRLMLLKQS
ncbi:hypothetical protein OS21_39360 [Dickeya oryzae]